MFDQEPVSRNLENVQGTKQLCSKFLRHASVHCLGPHSTPDISMERGHAVPGTNKILAPEHDEVLASV